MTKRKPTLVLSSRAAVFGSHVNTRTEKHGTEDVPACDYTISGMLLDPAELDALVGERAYEAFFREAASGQIDEPAFPTLKSLTLKDKFIECEAQLDFDGVSVALDDCRIGKLAIKLTVGGLSALSFQLQARPTAEQIGALSTILNAQGVVGITLGKPKVKADKQPDLPMDHSGSAGGNGDEDDDEQDEAA